MNEVKKVISIEGFYNVIMPINTPMIGWGNCSSATGHIMVAKTDDGLKVFLFNKNEEKRTYSPHGEYEYDIIDGKIYEHYSHERAKYLSFPFGWDENMQMKAVKVLAACVEEE